MSTTGLTGEYVRDAVTFLALRPGETLVVNVSPELDPDTVLAVRDDLREALEGTGVKGVVVMGMGAERRSDG